MDILKAEIESRKKAVSPSAIALSRTELDATASTSGDSLLAAPPKYLRRGDLEKLGEEQERERKRKLKEAADEQQPSQQAKRPTLAASGLTSSASSLAAAARLTASSSRNPSPSSAAAASSLVAQVVEKEKFNVSNQEAVRRLRAKGEPIRLFGESDKERRLRLRALELIEEKGGGTGQNDFRNALQSAETTTALELLEKRSDANKRYAEQDKLQNLKSQVAQDVKSQSGQDEETEAIPSSKAAREGVGMDSVLDLGLIKTDIDRVYPIIYYTLKGLLQEWAESLAARPDEVKHTTQGKLAAATQVQSADYLKPLFKKLRKRALTPDVLMRIAEIVHYVQKRQYRHANDSYLQLSIGNAPWPIGVTMVGIHERSGREKIFSSNVAHVLNDEVSRKYIQSLKRLMTFAQTKYPPKDISMMMG